MELARYKFIALGFGTYLVMIGINQWFNFPVIENILSTLGGLFIITGIVDLWLKKTYINDLSRYIVNGFFTKESVLQDLRTEDITNSLHNMISHLSLKLHDSIRLKFQKRASKYFIDIFKEDKDENLDTFYNKYALSIVMKKKTVKPKYIKSIYKLSYTLINNTENEVKHELFKTRGLDRDFATSTPEILTVTYLDVEADGKKVNIDISKLQTHVVPIPKNAKVNNKDKTEALTIRSTNDLNKKIEIFFNDTLKVTKHLIVKTKVNDIIFSCNFPRVASHVDINYIDENAKNIHVLSGFAFIDTENIDITDIQNNNKRIKVNDLVFPQDKINFISER